MYNKDIPYNDLPLVPGSFDYNQNEFLNLTITATEEISRLNGLALLIPNIEILISPLLIKESVESSAIENIHTTTLKVLQQEALSEKKVYGPEKEVLSYHKAILYGIEKIKKQNGIGFNTIVELQSIIEPDKTGIRSIPGTLISDKYGKAIYTPPEGKANIENLLYNLEEFINSDDDLIHAMIKMPVIHYQFESIHPFYDGNGRTGRILNILYLIFTKKLDYPILFLSEYINKNKNEYYSLLNNTTKTGDYSDFIKYFLEAIIEQSKSTSKKIVKINDLIKNKQIEIEKIGLDYYKITNTLFSYPFQSVNDFASHMNTSRQTINKYINKLEEKNIISTVVIGRNKLIFIKEFIDLLS